LTLPALLGSDVTGSSVQNVVNDELGQGHNDQANNSVDQSVLGITDTAAVTTGSDVAEAAVNDHDDGRNADDDRENINYLRSDVAKVGAAASAGRTTAIVVGAVGSVVNALAKTTLDVGRSGS